MKNKFKWIITFLILLIFFPNNVYAHSAATGNFASYGACKGDYDWCYSNIGLRFSVYTYKNGTLKYLKSVDYGTTYDSAYGRTALNNRTAKIATASAGKVAYTSGKKSVSWSSGYYKLSVESTNYYYCYFESKCEQFSSLKSQIESTFALGSTSADSNAVRKKINNFFGTSISLNDVYYAYITVEPTMYIYNKSGSSYYGTIYELLNLSDSKSGKSYYGLNELLYYSFPRSIMASKPSTSDPNSFVSNKGLVKLVSAANLNVISKTGIHSSNTNRKTNRDIISSKNGYGIGVFWVGDYGNVENPSCKQVCGNNTTLKCAEEYCASQNYSTSSKKATCINKCGYATPSSLKCGSTSASKSSTTTCSAKATGKKTTCSKSGYFKTTCTETTTITYPDLPDKNSLYKGTAKKFNYSISTVGTKTCTKEFNYKLFQFDYAKQVSSTSRKELKSSLDSSYFKNKDASDFKYSTSSSEWGTKNLKNPSSTYTFNWKSKTSSTSVDKSKSKTKELKLYADGNTTTTSAKYYKKVYNSSNTGTLSLSSIPYITSSVGTKNTKVTITRSSSSLNDVNTCNYVIKDPSKPTEILGCTVDIESDTNDSGAYSSPVTVKYTINYQTKASSTATPVNGNLGDLKYSIDNSTPNIKPTSKTITTTITGAEGETVTATMKLKTNNGTEGSCSKPITFASTSPACYVYLTKSSDSKKIELSTNASDLTCTLDGEPYSVGSSVKIEDILEEDNPSAKLKCVSTSDPDCNNEISVGSCDYIPSAKLDKIKDYCEESWDVDVKGYGNENACVADCYDACPEPLTSPTCKNSCETNWSDEGFASSGACVNACCNPGAYGEYVFRPITLEKKSDLTLVNPYNAFPNRTAGANWYGFEEKTAEDSFEGDPIFTINLTGSDIKKIKENTATLSKGQAYMPYEQIKEKDSKMKCYESSFIRSTNFRSLFDISDSWKGCEE